MPEKSTFVLVPGAWHGGWAWHPVARRLQTAGHRVVALTPPGLAVGDDARGVTLDDAVAQVVEAVERRDLTSVTLVAHSWGGYPVTGAALRIPQRVAKVVYVSAVVPQAGVSMTDELPGPGADFTRATIDASSDGAVTLPFDVFSQSLMQGEAEALQRLVFDLLTPQPARYLLDSLAAADLAALDIPTSYVLAEDDQALGRPGAEFADRLGVKPVLVPGTHEALLTHPDDVAWVLLA